MALPDALLTAGYRTQIIWRVATASHGDQAPDFTLLYPASSAVAPLLFLTERVLSPHPLKCCPCLGLCASAVTLYRASVQLSEKASALVLKGRPSRSVGHALPLASTPLRDSRVPSAGIKIVHTP